MIYYVQKLVLKMPKKSSSKAATAPKEGSDAGQEKPVPTPKKTNEIDDIFSSKKRKKPEKEKVGAGEEKNEKPKKMKKKNKSKAPRESEDAPGSKPRRRTNDGLAIYSAEELGFNNQNAGGTALCPFDCSCCF